MGFDFGYRAVRSDTPSIGTSASPHGSPKTSRPVCSGTLGRLRAQLLGGASGIALPAASMVLALGVGLSTEASAQTTISGNHTSTITLSNYPSGNPFTFSPGTTVTVSPGDAVDGNNSLQWTLTNNGALTGGSGINLTSRSTVTNVGSITGTNVDGVILSSGGIVSNQAGGSIGGLGYGVSVTGAAGTVTNIGTITGTNANGVFFGAGGSVTNQAGGMIGGGSSGVVVFGAAGTVTNAGTITGTTGDGIFFTAGGSVTNQAGGLIGGSIDGISVIGSAGTVTNAGAIMATRVGSIGVYLTAGGSVTNQAGGTISALYDGVRISGGAGTVTNAGTITGGSNAVLFTGTGANTLILQTGSVLNGVARGSLAGGATNALILQGAGTADNSFVNFNTLDVQAGGLWALNGSPTIGATTIDSGTLAIGDAGHTSATLTSPVSVNAGGTLAGYGTVIGNVAVNNGGAVQGGVPGAIGTLNVSGNLTFNSGGILSSTISPSGAASLVNVAGIATVTGGMVQVTASSFITHTQTFTILTATTIGGAFSSASIVGTAFARNPRLTEDAHDVFLTVDSGSFAAVLPASASVNQLNVAKAIDAGLAGGGALPAGFLALGNLPVTNLPGALTQISGETATGSQQTTFQAMTQFLGLLLDPFIDGRGGASSPASGATPYAEENSDASAYAADGKKRSKRERDAYAMFTKAPLAQSYDPRWSVWAAGFGGSQTTDGNATLGSNTATSRVFGTAVGADYRFSPYTIAGFALAGGGTNFSVAGAGTGRSDLFQAGAFVRHTVGPAYISAALA
jgi:hypothetical protein